MTGIKSKRAMTADKLRPADEDMNEQFIVICSECSEEHLTTEVEFLNVEENMQGRDVMYYVCPVTNTETSSMVYKK